MIAHAPFHVAAVAAVYAKNAMFGRAAGATVTAKVC
jgi:hypothetical protein